MIRRLSAALVILALLTPGIALAARGKKKDKEEPPKEETSRLEAATFQGLALRSIGPALTSGRISDLAVDPRDHATMYVTAASGGVWKTTTAGTTWTPIFDQQSSYSIGCVTIDPNDSKVIWVGTGENNSQRSVGYGDGVYKSVDAGATWKKMGLETSEHIGKIVVDPRDSNTVFVAAQGPLWSSGGERGLYKSVDGGESWKLVLEAGEHTGVTDLVYDPRNPDVLWAATYQRQRKVWTLINGGPNSGLHKSVDGGETWRQVTSGLPGGDVGRIGLAISPVNPDVLYAVIEAAGDAGGFFRSTDRGESWEKRSDYVSRSPQYYQELVADPHDVDRVYSMDVFLQVTEDGGKTFRRAGERSKHVDNHAMWIDPENENHLRVGCDGGLYESWDRAKSWRYFDNLPLTQFYKVSAGNDLPFYHVYAGTQDNFTLGAPSRTRSVNGIVNSDWYVTVGGDGFEAVADPVDTDIVYSQWQYGNLVRFDKKSGELVDVKPQVGTDQEALRFNWDSPLIISPHDHKRLYFAAQQVFRSDDRGDSWTAISEDLTRGIDRNELPVMGEVWSVDAVSKNRSTSIYGNLVALAESPLEEGLIYAGSDDGLVQVLEGDSWRRIESLPGVPDMTYVNALTTSAHDADTVYAAFNNHKQGDFKPYLLKSTDRGATWTSIAGDLPERGSVYSVVEDHVEPNLLFAGTEFGVFFTLDGGGHWIQLKGGIPTIAARDLDIQRRENDLVVGTFGRGIYILDDYTPLRGLTEEALEGGMLFPVKKTLMYIEAQPIGLGGKAFLGESYFTAPNPPAGSVFTYYLPEALETREQQRQKAEKETKEAGGTLSYPSWDDLRLEDREQDPMVVLTVQDADGEVVRRLTGPTGAGMHRVAWDLRWPSSEPVTLDSGPRGLFDDPALGPMVVPGEYSVSMATWVDGTWTPVGEAHSFTAEPLLLATLPEADRDELAAFQRNLARLQRAVLGAAGTLEEAQGRVAHLERALLDTPAAQLDHVQRLGAIRTGLLDVSEELFGDGTVSSRNESTHPGLLQRVLRVVSSSWTSTSAATGTQRQVYERDSVAFGELLERLRSLVEEDLVGLEGELEAVGAPWTPGRVPTWSPQ